MDSAAKHNHFKSGWRPSLGWLGFSALCFQYIIRPIATIVLTVVGKQMPEMHWLDSSLWELVALTLGTATLRSYDKAKGTTG